MAFPHSGGKNNGEIANNGSAKITKNPIEQGQ